MGILSGVATAPADKLFPRAANAYTTDRILPVAEYADVDGTLSGATQAPTDRILSGAAHAFVDGIIQE
jgi:hypothetical protein